MFKRDVQNRRTLLDRIVEAERKRAIDRMVEAGIPMMSIQEAIWIDIRDGLTDRSRR